MQNSIGKRIISTVGAGVVGSVLTLAVVTNTNILPEKEAPASQIAAADTSNYNVTNIASTTSLADMIEKSSKAIVGISNMKSIGNRFSGETSLENYGTGSGVIYNIDDQNAYIVTNNHVIEGSAKLEVTLENGEKATAEIVGKDALTDLAVLKIDKKYASTALTFGNSSKLRAGDPVVAIGSPLSLDFSGTVTKGIISSPSRSVNVQTAAGLWEMNVIQTDAAINPGNSGGALLNEQGEIIGINSLKIAQSGIEGIGFAIPSDDVVPLIEQMTKKGEIERPYIGVSLADLAEVPAMYVQDLPQSIEGGVLIARVDPDSAAGKAGLHEEDIITEVNGKPIKNAMDLRKMLYTDYKIGDTIQLTVYKGANKRIVEVKLTNNSNQS